MADDVILNRAGTIERCVSRVREEAEALEQAGGEAQTHEDALVLNLLRACESSIDLAMHVVRRRALGMPQSSRDAFAMLADAGLLAPALAERMQRMVGFRNIAVHRYREIDPRVLRAIVLERLDDFTEFTAAMIRLQS